ncbi:MAG: hypothetical protein ACRC14_12960 [Paracoccaceae bacterium]
MTKRFLRCDKWSAEKFRTIEAFGPVWRIEHFFLKREDIDDPWLKSKPALDLDWADYRFSDKPKSKKVPDLTMSAGKIFMKGVIYDRFFRQLIGDFVTTLQTKISGEPYYFIRPEVVLDCVDLERSEWRQHENGYRFAWPSLVLRDVPQDAPPIFRPGQGAEFWVQPVFSDGFVSTLQINKIVSIDFEEVYPLISTVP